MAPGTAPPKEEAAGIRDARIVAMEAPPLGVPPGFSSAWTAGAIGTFGPGAGIAALLGILIESPAASQKGGEKSRSLQTALDANQTWVPTAVLANEVQAQLAAGRITATLLPGIKPIPGVDDRGYTVAMENWLGPIRA